MSNDDLLADLLMEWEDAAGRGEARTPEDLCRDRPDLLAPLRQLLARLAPLTAVLRADELEPAVPALPEEDLGRYRAVAFHARGGLGEVFVAEDRELGRTVALKGIRPAVAADPDARGRFLAEAAITTRLEHPGVVPMYGLVEGEDGTPYYAMRFVRGTTFAEEIARHHAPAPGPTVDPAAREVEFRRLLQHFVAVCKTVGYAHARRVLHRDLKPDNIMIGPYGETLVLDWGLAKVIGEPDADATPDAADADPTRPGGGISATRPGSAKGAPAYMSPEQARGEWDRVGPATDVFGLGATLYVLLAGRRPHDGTSVGEVLEKAKAGVVPAPRSVNPAVPRPLDAVCRKAMEPRPGDRYAGALDLALDVERWLAGEPVSAWREPFAARARRWARRHRTLVTATAAAGLVAAVVFAVLGVRLDRAYGELERRNDELAAALKGEREARALAEDRKDRMRVLFRDAVAFTWWTPATKRDHDATQAQLLFLAAQYEQAVRGDGGSPADDGAFLELVRQDRYADPAAEPRRKALAAAVGELVARSAAEPANTWLALWAGVARVTLGQKLLDAGDLGGARRELTAARDGLTGLAASGRPEVPLVLGYATNELYRLTEAEKAAGTVPAADADREMVGWLDESLAALGDGQPPGPLADALRDNWVFLRAQLRFYRLFIRFGVGKIPGAEAAYRAFAEEMTPLRVAVRHPSVGTQLVNLEARSRRYAALLSADLDLAHRDLDQALGTLAARRDAWADDPVYRDEFVRAQVGYVWTAARLVAADDAGKVAPLGKARRTAIAVGCLAVLADRDRAALREPFLRQLFPRKSEDVMRADWEATRKAARE